MTEATSKPLVMGLVNVLFETDPLHLCEQMALAGADIIELGLGLDASSKDEHESLIPLIKTVKSKLATPLSVFTTNSDVMQAAAELGANMLHDPLMLAKTGSMHIAAELKLPICLMHSEPMVDSVNQLYNLFEERIQQCIEHGILQHNLLLNPGIGFGKPYGFNIRIMQQLKLFSKFSIPVLVGIARESLIGQITDTSAEHRIFGSIAANVLAVTRGASIVRTREVAAVVDAMKVLRAIG